jgi:hypothetical protein
MYVRLAYQPPANSTFLSEQTSHQQLAKTSQQYSSLRTNHHQPSATSQPNNLNCSCFRCRHGYFHVVNNDYTHWEMYAIGGSAEPTINSQGNRYLAPTNPFAKEV